ncbi:MAG: TrkA family potassium uptake protein [Chloroflexi bacterium]|jgi:trk system potassium uptake protein TrkA|nr:NAD-binding protein [Anaerolineaceae bacterium]NLI45282.1 TrkA family potassium uptake protein [Chloroflexota bacterium]HQH57782.1 NAD-binding protein [Anaerolineaceae bacterium]
MKVMIIGGGKVGTYLANYLLSENHEVRLIELREEEKARILLDVPESVVYMGNGTDPDVLEAAGIRKMDVLAAVTGQDEVNLVATSLARFEFMVPRTIARINHPKNAWMFSDVMGVDVALNQADLMAALIAEEMSLGDMITLHKLRKGKFDLVEEKVAPNAIANGKMLRDLKFPPQSTIVAVIRSGELLIPNGELEFQTADEVLAVVRKDQKKDLARFFDRVL